MLCCKTYIINLSVPSSSHPPPYTLRVRLAKATQEESNIEISQTQRHPRSEHNRRRDYHIDNGTYEDFRDKYIVRSKNWRKKERTEEELKYLKQRNKDRQRTRRRRRQEEKHNADVVTRTEKKKN